MIIIYHNYNKAVKVVTETNDVLPFNDKGTIASVLIDVALKNPESKIVWCDQNFEKLLNLEGLNESLHHKKIMLSYNPDVSDFIGKGIGYVDGAVFIKVNKKETYPTWQMSGTVGVIQAEILCKISDNIKPDSNFDYFLNSIAKLYQPLGLLCYSEPSLIKNNLQTGKTSANKFLLFRFVKQHYRARWTVLLFFNLMFYEKQVALLPFIFSFFYRKRKIKTNLIENIDVQSSRKVLDTGTIDVIIPTIGRKEYLLNVLKDLSIQTHLPKKVIIVEQNPHPDSSSELDYLADREWPFFIKHIFTHQAGACNARNLALAEVESEWVFLNDDDNEFSKDLIEHTLANCVKYGTVVASNSYLTSNDVKTMNHVYQAPFFGSGNSFIKSKLLEKVSFRMGFEFGYGEDNDFGMQLRNAGFDVLYFPNPEILHLKAPIGGFRTKPDLIWNKDAVKPKPSPTISLFKLLHETKEQHKGYKTILFFKAYRKQPVKNPVKYFFKFQREWEKSIYWADKLKNK
ncbi:glycosyltransferase family 2 protein [Flavobacterium sp. 2]|uniref:glycosyltransferase family 2 protein n=1 Tax=Flavobacterium sp. 2 TaxID=308053 RepID=UPI003CE7186A